MTGDPSFSVVIPCYNQAEYLREAIESVLAAPVPVEVIVVNDGSTDDTLRVAGEFGDRIRLVDQPNRGLSAARNAGLASATREFVNFLDADDWLDRDFFAAHARAIVAHPEASVLCGDWALCDAQKRGIDEEHITFPDDVYRYLLAGNRIPCHALTIRRTALAEVGAFDESLRSYEDWDMWLRLAAAGHRFAAALGAKVYHRRYVGSISRDIDRMLDGGRRVLRKHRGKHLGARLRGWLAIRYGLFCNNVLPELRATHRRDGRWATGKRLVAELWRRPTFCSSAALWMVCRACPPLRRALGVSPRPYGLESPA